MGIVATFQKAQNSLSYSGAEHSLAVFFMYMAYFWNMCAVVFNMLCAVVSKIRLWIHTWPFGPSCRRHSESQLANLYIKWANPFTKKQSCFGAALHSDVSSISCWLHPVLMNNRASALTRDYFNMNPMSGRQYLRRKHLGLLPLNPLWVRAGVLGCDSDHARKSNDGCLMTRMASPILTQLIYKPAAELPLPASSPTNPLCPS